MSSHDILLGCPSCNGTGSIFNPLTGGYNLCEKCYGKGVLIVPKEVETTSEEVQRYCKNSITPPEEPKITCPACGNPNIRARRLGGYMEISCSKCGTSLERPIVESESPLENVVDLVNEYEHIRYKVNKSKEV